MNIKDEIIDDFEDKKSSDKSFYNKFENYNYCKNTNVKDETLQSPKKLLKTRVDYFSKSGSYRKSLHFNGNDSQFIKTKHLKHIKDKSYGFKTDVKVIKDTSVDSSKKSSEMLTKTYDIFLQELFSWNPEWLQGRAMNKPPIKKFEKLIISNPFKLEYNKDEYIPRHIPFIQTELFIRLSDSFKNDAPSRCKHEIFIKDCESSGDLDLNKKLLCYSVRDSNGSSKPIAKVNDIVVLQLSVISNTNNQLYQKLYFGVVIAHSMLELNELEPQAVDKFSQFQNYAHNSLLWDEYTILTKRSRETTIVSKQIALIEAIMNASFYLKQADNLLFERWNCTKLISNILSAVANIHQFSASELKDYESVKQTLIQNAMDMINKSNPMVYFKGVNNIMLIDICAEIQRRDFLVDIVIETIERNDKTNGNVRFLVMAKNDEEALWWREALKRKSTKSQVRPWSVDNNRGWTRHQEVKNYVRHNAVRIQNSCSTKLKQLNESSKSYKQLSDRKESYQHVINSCNHFGAKNSAHLMPSALIAKEELLIKGYQTLLKDCNVVIGTFENIINCQLLFKETIGKKLSFDCCVIDESHRLPDVNMFSIIHTGIKSIIIAGDSDGFAVCNNPDASQHKFNISLFNRIFMKVLNL